MSDTVPGSIIGRFRKGGLGELGAGHITNNDQFGASGNRRCCLVRPVETCIGNLGLDRFDALLLVRPLGHREGLFMLKRQILPAIDNAIKTGDLTLQAKVNTQVEMSNRLCSIRDLALHVDIPASSRILRETARLDDTLDGPRQPQAKPVSAVRDRVVLQADIGGLERNPAERTLAATPLEFNLLALPSSGDVLRVPRRRRPPRR